MWKKTLFLTGLIVLTFVLGVIFLLVGMNIGGNYFTTVELFGARGYEATGNLGFFIGIVVGVIVSIVLYRKLFHK